MQRVGFNRKLIWLITAAILVAVLVAVDQIAKKVFENLYLENGATTVIENFFYLSLTYNSGAAYSFLADTSWGQILFLIIN